MPPCMYGAGMAATARVLALAEGGLKAEVMRAVNRFAEALRDKSGEEA